MVQRSDVESIIRSVSGSANFSDSDHATKLRDIGVDSLDLSGILLEVEEKYGVKVPDEDINRLQTIDNIVDYVNEKSGGS